MESYIRDLESLEKYSDSYGSILIPIILGKPPQELRRNITCDIEGDDWDFQTLQTAIFREFTIQDAYSSPTSSASDDFMPTAAFMTKTHRAPGSIEKRNQMKSKPCVFCGEIHAPVSCSKVTDVKERKALIKEKGLCFNCFAKLRVSKCK
jgi:hypothetical protein